MHDYGVHLLLLRGRGDHVFRGGAPFRRGHGRVRVRGHGARGGHVVPFCARVCVASSF